MSSKTGFYWERHAKVEDLFFTLIKEFKKKNLTITGFEEKLRSHTSSRLLDWIDHLIMPDTDQLRSRLEKLGFIAHWVEETEFFAHPGVSLPRILLSQSTSDIQAGLALRVESIAHFLQANNISVEIEGSPFSPYRRSVISVHDDISFVAVERRGTSTFEPTHKDDKYLGDYFSALETWRSLPRGHEDEDKALAAISKQTNELIGVLGQNLAAHVVCRCERDYWLSRNYAGRMQKSRHETLGLGWANHDHHTFRSSRKNFSTLISLFSQLGFQKRERFYAGKEAGWGAQVMENTVAGLSLFLDVDLSPEEVDIDFTQLVLQERDKLGTVGLWCALHGDSILKAGMHHLAAQFIFNQMIAEIAKFNVNYMAPFSDFSYLKQAFSVAERWIVSSRKIDQLLSEKKITQKQADNFASNGAVGSHLENIQRREGYKGFNKKNVSAIIKEVDPREQG